MAEDTRDAGTRRSVGAVIIAAGSSSRMGAPKQLLEVDGEALLLRTYRAVAASGADPVVVVLGAGAEALRSRVQLSNALVVVNPDWSTGMASSISAGLRALERLDPGIEAVLLTPCDLPGITGRAIAQLIGAHRSPAQIVASRYDGRLGAPAVFGRGHFPALLALKGDSGARSLLNSGSAPVIAVEAPELGFDLDTPADVARWESERSGHGHD